MRFGDRVRQMGQWNVSTDGSLDIPAAVIREAAIDLDGQRLHDALREIKPRRSANCLSRPLRYC